MSGSQFIRDGDPYDSQQYHVPYQNLHDDARASNDPQQQIYLDLDPNGDLRGHDGLDNDSGLLDGLRLPPGFVERLNLIA